MIGSDCYLTLVLKLEYKLQQLIFSLLTNSPGFHKLCSLYLAMIFDEKLNALNDTELRDLAKSQFGETPEILESSLEELRTWISRSPHLQDIQQDDKTLKMFLRGCKLSLERTKEKLDMYHSVKGSLPE